MSGKINDLAWDGESKRIIVGGEGKDKFGAAFFMDSGSSCGEITGHSKVSYKSDCACRAYSQPITSLSVRHQRPFRAVSGSDDTSVCLHTAVPFKYDKIFNHHTRFVRDVQYAPNGDLFASVASDGKLFFYDGKTGEKKAEAARPETSSLMAASWALDSAQIATAGADGVVAIWDAATGQAGQSWKVGSDVESQQNGIVWANPNVIASVSLSGTINLFDPREGNSWRKLHGPTKAITASGLNEKDQTFYAGSFDGSIKAFSTAEDEGAWKEIEGGGHAARIVGVASDTDGKVWAAGWDDRATSISGTKFASSISAKSQPTGIAATPSATYIASASGLEVHPTSGSPFTQPGNISAVGANGPSVAYGSGKTLTLATNSGSSLKTEADFTDNKGDILSIAFSPDGKLVAAGDSAGRIILVDVGKKEVLVSSRWQFHTGRVAALSFSPDGKRLASAGGDESIYVWEVEKVMKNTAIKVSCKGRHELGQELTS